VEIINNTPLEAIALPGEVFRGCPVLLVVVKGTFDIFSDCRVVVAQEQIPIAFGDEFYDGMGQGSVKFESDIAPFKSCADIVLVGKAHAPAGHPVQVLDVMLRVGTTSRIIRVFGDRFWRGGGSLSPDKPSVTMPFVTMDLVYEKAFGGIDMEGGGYCAENMVGKGFLTGRSKMSAEGMPLPNLEDPNHLIKSLKDHPRPVGFGFYHRAWMPRLGYLLAFERQQNQELPPATVDDLIFEQYNGAHPDLQLDGYLNGDEEVDLVNLSPEGRVRFELPGTKVTCKVSKKSVSDEETREAMGEEKSAVVKEKATEVEEETVRLNLDTLCLIPEDKKLFMLWRGLCPIDTLDAAEVDRVYIL
jgi:hypothetical protein